MVLCFLGSLSSPHRYNNSYIYTPPHYVLSYFHNKSIYFILFTCDLATLFSSFQTVRVFHSTDLKLYFPWIIIHYVTHISTLCIDLHITYAFSLTNHAFFSLLYNTYNFTDYHTPTTDTIQLYPTLPIYTLESSDLCSVFPHCRSVLNHTFNRIHCYHTHL